MSLLIHESNGVWLWMTAFPRVVRVSQLLSKHLNCGIAAQTAPKKTAPSKDKVARRACALEIDVPLYVADLKEFVVGGHWLHSPHACR